MRILHTADWHLGIVFNGVNRINEQKQILDEMCEICEKMEIDVVLISGDIFNGTTTPAEADEMLLDAVIRMADGGNRAIIAIAGNDDEGTRFGTSHKFAEQSNIFFLKNFNYQVSTKLPKDKNMVVDKIGPGFIKLHKGEENIVVAFVPYPNKKVLRESNMEGADSKEKIAKLYTTGASNFELNAVNIAMGHLNVTNPKFQTKFYTQYDESIFPKNADYVALGHIHDLTPTREKSKIYYSGSSVMIHPEENVSKSVIILNTERNKITHKEILKLKTPKKVYKIEVSSFDDALAKLNGKQNEYVHITFLEESLSKEEVIKIKQDYPFIVKFNILPKMKFIEEVKEIKTIVPETAFAEFVLNATGDKATASSIEIFKEAYSLKEKEHTDETN